MGQAGLGYFSRIAAWNQNKGKVLILDLARFKYPVNWAPINTVWKSIEDLDEATKAPRGYLIFKKYSKNKEIFRTCNIWIHSNSLHLQKELKKLNLFICKNTNKK